MKILFVQFSDIHWRDESSPEPRRAKLAGSAIANTLGSLPDEIVMIYSGDLAWSGAKLQFKAVENYLLKFEESISECYLNIPIHRTICPGNHDCDLSSKKDVRDVLIEKAIEDKLFKGDICDELLTAQDNFFSFAESFCPLFMSRQPLWNSGDRRLGWRHFIQLKDFALEIIGLNTAWVSIQHEESGKIHFPEQEFVPSEVPKELSVTVMHHPLSWLEASSAHALRDSLLKNADIILSGHEHDPITLTVRKELVGDEAKIFEGAAFFDHVSHEKDGFGIVLLDTNTSNAENYHIRWNGEGFTAYQGDNPINFATHTPELFKINTSPTISFSIDYSLDFGQWINNPELPLFKQSKGEILLNDIYVLPELKKIKIQGSVSSKGPIKEAIDLTHTQFTIVLGPSNSGKTCLAKAICRSAINGDVYPLYLDGRKIRMHLANIVAYLEKNIAEQYGPYAQTFKAKNNSQKILIIDDFHAFASKSKSKKVMEILDSLRPKFGRLLILGHDLELPLDLVTFFSETKWGVPIGYGVQPFSFKKRNELIDRWIALDENIEDEDLAQKSSDINKTLDIIIGRNFVQAYPAYLLAVMQGMEAGGEVDLSTSTHGHLYEIFIKTCLAKKATATNYNIFSNFLGMLAFRAFSEDRSEISDDFLKSVHTQFEYDYDLDRPLASLKRDLLDVGLIVKINGCYYFSEKFVLYYFVAYYIKDRIHDTIIRNFVSEMAAKLWVEDYANVMLFVTHLTKDEFVVDEMLKKTNSMFSDFVESDLKEDIAFLKNFGKEAVAISCSLNTNNDDRVDELQHVRNESMMPEYASSPPRHFTESEVDEVARFNAAIKGMQLVGQVLKNFPASFLAERKVAMAEQCVKLGLRCLGFYFDMIKNNQSQVVDEVSEMLSPALRATGANERRQYALEFVSWLCRITTFGIVKRISYAIGSRELGKTYKRIFEGDRTDAYKLIEISLMLDHQGAFPEDKIKTSFADWSASNYFMAVQLRMLVRRHFKLFNVPLALKQSTAAHIEIDLVDMDETGSRTKLVKRQY